MDAVFESAALDILDTFGDLNATYEAAGSTPVPCPVLVNYNSELTGDDMQTLYTATTVEFLRSSGHSPKRGEKIYADGQTFIVERTYSKDSVWVKLVVK